MQFKFKNNPIAIKTKGFTLVEAVISIALFGIITIFMSNFIITIGKFTFDNDRRSDISADVDAISTFIKNELRNATELSIGRNGECIMYEKNEKNYAISLTRERTNDRKYIILSSVIPGSNEALVCPDESTSTLSVIRQINNPDTSKILNLNFELFAKSVGNTNLLRGTIVACDADATVNGGGATNEQALMNERRIFSCDLNENPYILSFAVATDLQID